MSNERHRFQFSGVSAAEKPVGTFAIIYESARWVTCGITNERCHSINIQTHTHRCKKFLILSSSRSSLRLTSDPYLLLTTLLVVIAETSLTFLRNNNRIALVVTIGSLMPPRSHQRRRITVVIYCGVRCACY